MSVLSVQLHTAVWACSGRHCVVKRFAAELCAPTTWCSFFVTACGILGANSWKRREKLTQSRSTAKQEQFNPMKLTPLLPSISSFSPISTHILYRCIQIGVYPKRRVFKKDRAKKSQDSLSFMQSPSFLFIFSLQKCVFFF